MGGTYKFVVWDFESAKEERSGQIEGSAVTCLAMDSQGRVATGGPRAAVRLWPARAGAPQSFAGAKGSIKTVALSREGNRLAALADNGGVFAWNTATGVRLIAENWPAGSADAVAWTPDGRRLATGGEDGAIRLWDPESGKIALTLEGHDSAVTSLAFSPDGQVLASSGLDDAIRLWDAPDRDIMDTIYTRPSRPDD
jgi:hypothetical protein